MQVAMQKVALSQRKASLKGRPSVTSATQLRIRLSQLFETMPKWQLSKKATYPDIDRLAYASTESLSLLNLVAIRASYVAQVGKFPVFRTGGFQELANFQVSIDQNQNKICRVIYRCKSYNNGSFERANWSFEFYGEDGGSLGKIDNRPDNEYQNLIKDGYVLRSVSDQDQFDLEADEIIAGIQLGLDTYENVINVQFMIARE